jgi:putative transposase
LIEYVTLFSNECIHLNPLRAGLVKDFDHLGQHRFSGHSVILEKSKNDWQDVGYVLKYFAQRRTEARKRYLGHVRQRIEMGKRPGRNLNENLN